MRFAEVRYTYNLWPNNSNICSLIKNIVSKIADARRREKPGDKKRDIFCKSVHK